MFNKMRGRNKWALAAGASWAIPSLARADVLQSLTRPFDAALAGGDGLTALALVFVAGLATSLTPCVYPMIAITVSVFGAHQSKSRWHAAALSSVFVLGIAALFTPLGVLSAATGNAFGSVLSNPWVMVGLSLFFVAMALSMFGLFDLALPPSMQNKLVQVGGVGVRGAFGVGLVSGLIAAPCTGPVLAVLLGWIAKTGNMAFGALALFVYSLGLGVLFWIVGTFAVALPKSGRWVVWTKSVFGIAMLVLALHYIRGVLSLPELQVRDAAWMWVSLGLVIAGLIAGAVHLSLKDEAIVGKLRKITGIALTTLGCLGLLNYAEALPKGAHIEWGSDFATMRAEALQSARPLLIDFGADWCGACKELERGPLSDPAVVAEARRFVTVRVDLSTNKATEDKWALLSSYEQNGLPFIVMHHADGREASRVTGMLSTDELLAMMKSTR